MPFAEFIDYYLVLWIVVIVIAFIIEAETLDLISIWFSLGAIAAVLSGAVGLNIWGQVWVFSITSLLLLFFTRPLAKKYFKVNTVKTNADRVIGKVATIIKPVKVGERGTARVDGKVWTVISEERETLVAGEKVEVLAIEGVKLLVSKIRHNEII